MADQLRILLDVRWPACEITLKLSALFLPQQGHLLSGFDARRHDPKIKTLFSPCSRFVNRWTVFEPPDFKLAAGDIRIGFGSSLDPAYIPATFAVDWLRSPLSFTCPFLTSC